MGNIRKFDFIAGIETSAAPVATDPSTGSDPVILDYADRNYTQGTEAQADNTAIKNLDTSDREDGDLVLVKSSGYIYRYDSSETTADDGDFFLAPTSNNGRWVRVSDIDPATGDLDVPNDLDVGGDVTVTGSVTVTGDATINGTLTTINSSTLEIVDANIVLNNGGTESTANAQDSGFTVEMSDATDCKVGFDSTLTSKFMCGEVGAEEEIVTTGHTQTMTASKTFNEETTFLKSHVMAELGSTPSTPASGYRKLYPTSTGWKDLDSAGLVSDVGAGGGSGSGEINLIEDTNTASNWTSTGAGITVATTTTAAELPLEDVFSSGVKITPVSGTSDYVKYRFFLQDALASQSLKLEWYQKPLSGYTNDDIKVELWINDQTDYAGSFTEVPLASDITGDTLIQNVTERFSTTFTSGDATDSEKSYELRFYRTSGTTALVLQNVIVGPGNGAADSEATTSALGLTYQPNAQVWVNTGNGYGSTNDKIRRFTTTVSSVGTGITYADSASAGASFTINEDGIYAIDYADSSSAAALQIGVSLNSSQLTTAIGAITAADRIAYEHTSAASFFASTQAIVRLSSGDVIRPHNQVNTSPVNDARVSFRITQMFRL